MDNQQYGNFTVITTSINWSSRIFFDEKFHLNRLHTAGKKWHLWLTSVDFSHCILQSLQVKITIFIRIWPLFSFQFSFWSRRRQQHYWPMTCRCLLTGSCPPWRCHVTRGTGHASAAHSSVTVSPNNAVAMVNGVHVNRGLTSPEGAVITHRQVQQN